MYWIIELLNDVDNKKLNGFNENATTKSAHFVRKKAKAIFQKQLREKIKHHCINALMVLYFSYIHKFDCEIKQ